MKKESSFMQGMMITLGILFALFVVAPCVTCGGLAVLSGGTTALVKTVGESPATDTTTNNTQDVIP